MCRDDATEVKRHTLVSKMLLDFNRTTGAITVGPASESGATCLETDLVHPQLLHEA
jgi:hypothetical protein